MRISLGASLVCLILTATAACVAAEITNNIIHPALRSPVRASGVRTEADAKRIDAHGSIGTTGDPAITINPQTLAVLGVPLDSSVTGSLIITNHSALNVTFLRFRLRYGATHGWSIISPVPPQPFTLKAHDSMPLTFRYTAPHVRKQEIDDDTVFLATNNCPDYAIAALLGSPKMPAIFSACYNFGNAAVDLLTSGGDTLSSGKHVWVASIGSDTLHVSGLSIQGTIAPLDADYPENTFRIGTLQTTGGALLAMPAPGNEWSIPPGDTVYVEILGHPHHAGYARAVAKFDNDANGVLVDTACLEIFGLAPGILARGIDYGTHLYGTTTDSFFVVRNTGSLIFDILKDSPAIVDSAQDTAAFVLRDYRDPVTHSNVHYDSTVPLTLYPADPSRGLAGDTVRIPYRFIARKYGTSVEDLEILNTTPIQPTIRLQGHVVIPCIVASGSCPADSIFLGATTTQEVMVTNAGTAPLTIEQASFGGADSSAWTILGWKNRRTGAQVAIPFALPPADAPPGQDTVIGTLRFTPTRIGHSTATLHFTGHDELGRYAGDSASGTFYTWGTFPYDTTVELCNRAFASGLAATDVHLQQYVTRDTAGEFIIENTDVGRIDITDIQCTDPDYVNGFVSFTLPQKLPFTLQPGDTLSIPVTFRPNPMPGRPLSDGRRNYTADFTIINTTGTPIISHFTGRGHMVDMHSYIPRNIQAHALTITRPVPIIIDRWTDTLGSADMRGFILEVVHYNRAALFRDSAYNESGEGGLRTNSQGAVFAENIAESNMQDSAHTFGRQGYYELNTQGAPQNCGHAGTLLNIRFFTCPRGWIDTMDGQWRLRPRFASPPSFQLLVDTVPLPTAVRWDSIPWDTSELTYFIKNPIDVQQTLMEYVNISQDPGRVDIADMPDDWGLHLYPNAFVSDGALVFYLIGPARVWIDAHDVAGRSCGVLLPNTDLLQGYYGFPIRLSQYPAGSYFLTIHGDSFTKTVRVVKKGR